MADQSGEADLRAENVSKVVDGFALQSYKLKELCVIQKSNSWKETYFQETAADLTGGANSAVKGIPRGANFPNLDVSWTEHSKRHLKYGGEGTIDYEDKKTNDVDVISRTLKRIARAVAKAVDDEIWDVISESVANLPTPVNITTLAIAAGREWDAVDSSQRDPIQNILNAKVEIATNNYDPDVNGYLLLSYKDKANLLGNQSIRNAGQFWTDSPTKKGWIGMLLGLKVIASPSVQADYSMIIIKHEAATWKSVVGLTTITKEEPGMSTLIRSWEIGTTQLKNPNAICLITNTQK